MHFRTRLLGCPGRSSPWWPSTPCRTEPPSPRQVVGMPEKGVSRVPSGPREALLWPRRLYSCFSSIILFGCSIPWATACRGGFLGACPPFEVTALWLTPPMSLASVSPGPATQPTVLAAGSGSHWGLRRPPRSVYLCVSDPLPLPAPERRPQMPVNTCRVPRGVLKSGHDTHLLACLPPSSGPALPQVPAACQAEPSKHLGNINPLPHLVASKWGLHPMPLILAFPMSVLSLHVDSGLRSCH